MKPYMTLKSSIVLTVLALFLLPHLATAQGNLVVNGGFDTDASGWTATNIAFGGGYSSKSGNPPGCFFLNASSLSSVDPIISQTINSLTLGTIYSVSGDYLYGPNGAGSLSTNFGVAIDGAFLFETVAPSTSIWYSFSFLYTATSSSAVLSLSSLINGTFYYGIDNISMQAIPEPLPSLLILLGSGLFLYARRACKKSSPGYEANP